MSEISTKLLCRDWKPMILDCVLPAESRPLFSSSSLFLRNGLRHHVGMYWIFTQTTMLMPTCSRQTLVKDHAFLVKPACYLKSLYGVRGFYVCAISVVQEICTIKWILSLCKQNPTKPYRLRIWGYPYFFPYLFLLEFVRHDYSRLKLLFSFSNSKCDDWESFPMRRSC